ncbi:hypothetical protein FLA_3188 [Filimonas lacunae]|nr:hypothetical protein FLA_3188 [Filimonas lacunae]
MELRRFRLVAFFLAGCLTIGPEGVIFFRGFSGLNTAWADKG